MPSKLAQLEALKRRARLQAWRDGTLRYKIRGYQKAVYDLVWIAILNPSILQYCLTISRRWGKSFSLLVICVEYALRYPGSQIRMAAPTLDEIRKITGPLMRKILMDCPLQYMPRYASQEKVWTFYNGSQIHIAGVNGGHEDSLRGTGTDLAIVDEGGFIDNFNYLIKDVLMPQLMDRDGSTMIVSSTPPTSPAHDYVSLALQLEKDEIDSKLPKGSMFCHRDIHSTDFSDKKLAIFAKAAGGEGSTTWKREYLALFVREEKLAIIPEWDEPDVDKDEAWRAYLEAEVLAAQRDPRRQFYGNLDALDIGESKFDFQAALYGFYEFHKGRLVVERERIDSVMPRMTTAELGDAIKADEMELWGDVNANPPRPPVVKMRVADNNDPRMLVDLAANQGLPFFPTTKESLTAMVNKVRMWVKDGRILISPECSNLRKCLQHGIWKDKDHIGREFIRTEALGHLDALAALIYLVRNCPTENPIPAGWGLDAAKQFIPPHLLQPAKSQTARTLESAFGGRRKVH